jgi:hypothetical protein
VTTEDVANREEVVCAVMRSELNELARTLRQRDSYIATASDGK